MSEYGRSAPSGSEDLSPSVLATLARLTDPIPDAIAAVREALTDLSFDLRECKVTDKAGNDSRSYLLYLVGEAENALDDLAGHIGGAR